MIKLKYNGSPCNYTSTSLKGLIKTTTSSATTLTLELRLFLFIYLVYDLFGPE